MSSGPWEIPYVHDCRRFDGLFRTLQDARTALAGTLVQTPVYTCFDPSLRDQYPPLGTMIAGHRIPGGGDLERAVNRFFPVFARQVRGVRGDLIHIWSVSLAALIGYRSDVVVTVPDIAKLTTHYYGWSASYLHNRMLRYLPRARAIVCFTESARAEILRSLGLPEESVHVISPTPLLGAPPFPLPRPGRPPTEAAPWTLLYVAADRRHKNIEFFLRVIARTDSRFRGVVVTQPTPATLDLARRLGISERVVFQSTLPEMAAAYRTADVLVHPSLHEGFGLPLLEAMSQGLPVLASNRTCIPEVVGSGGRTLDPGDPAAWAAAIEDLTDLDRYRDASRRASERASEFTVERARSELLKAYSAAHR